MNNDLIKQVLLTHYGCIPDTEFMTGNTEDEYSDKFFYDAAMALEDIIKQLDNEE